MIGVEGAREKEGQIGGRGSSQEGLLCRAKEFGFCPVGINELVENIKQDLHFLGFTLVTV